MIVSSTLALRQSLKVWNAGGSMSETGPVRRKPRSSVVSSVAAMNSLTDLEGMVRLRWLVVDD